MFLPLAASDEPRQFQESKSRVREVPGMVLLKTLPVGRSR